MSTILKSAPAPFPGTDRRRSQFAGLGKSKRGPKATKEEEASGVEKEDIGDGEDFFMFNRMRRRVREEIKQKEANGGVVFDIFEALQKHNDSFKKKLMEEEANGGGEKKEEGVIEEEYECTICEEKGHAYYGCPWLKKLPDGPVPDVIPSEWMAECTYCHGLNIDKAGNCASCKRGTKKVVEKICPICWQTGHLDNSDEDCLIFGLDDTPENDPFRQFLKS